MSVFFAYYIGAPQISFFAYYIGVPSSLSSLTIWAPSDQFLLIQYRGPSQISFFSYYMGHPPQINYFACYRRVVAFWGYHIHLLYNNLLSPNYSYCILHNHLHCSTPVISFCYLIITQLYNYCINTVASDAFVISGS